MLHDPLWLGALALAMAGTGLVSGALAGLLGVGGGIVIVPVLFNVLPLFGIPEAVQMKLAVGTSLATIIPTSIQSARKHFAKGTMDLALLRNLAPSIAGGVALGTLLAVWLKGDALTLVFAVVAVAVAANMAVTSAEWRLRESFPAGAPLHGIGACIGTVSAMMGIGGGTVGVPILSAFGAPMRGRGRDRLGASASSSPSRPPRASSGPAGGMRRSRLLSWATSTWSASR